MADDTATPPVQPAPIARAASTVGATAVAGGSVVTVADVINWIFQCIDQHKLVTPDQATSMAMAMGLILLGHSLEKFGFGGKKRRASDSNPIPTGS